MRSLKLRGAACVLLEEHGTASAAVAADRAEERFTNIDVGGFAYWKNVETFIRHVLHRSA
jgi:creatinine amidohydrolase/Fe(II)-dependent formamide hydrolase-like protein